MSHRKTSSPEGMISRIKRAPEMVRGARLYLKTELWNRQLPPVYSVAGLLLRVVRYLHLMVHSLRENPLRLHASALTYNTLLSLLPVLAVALAIAKGLGQDDYAIKWLLDYTSEMPEAFRTATETLLETVANTNFAKLGAIGALFLFYVSTQMLSKVEVSFNRIWGVEKKRSLPRQITNYTSVLVVVPILLLTAISTTAHWGFTGQFLDEAGKWAFTPFLATSLGFAILYGAMPNTEVKIWPAIASGFLGSILFHLWLRLFISFQPGVLKYNLIYGALAFFPIFLIWLYFSWFIILIGAKFSYAIQNGNNFVPELSVRKANTRARILLALAILKESAKFQRDEAPLLNRKKFLNDHNINPFLLDGVTELLVTAGLIAAIGEDQDSYALLKEPARIPIAGIINLFIEKNGEDIDALEITGLSGDITVILDRSMAGLSTPGETIADLMGNRVQAKGKK